MSRSPRTALRPVLCETDRHRLYWISFDVTNHRVKRGIFLNRNELSFPRFRSAGEGSSASPLIIPSAIMTHAVSAHLNLSRVPPGFFLMDPRGMRVRSA